MTRGSVGGAAGPDAGPTHRGSCLCGAVRYRVEGPLRAVRACHCTQCRKSSGHHVAATECASADLALEGAEPAWYASSAEASRAFCPTCGSNLFWRRAEGVRISIFAGTLDGPTGLRMDSQVHAGSKGDYYALPDVPVLGRS